MAPADLPCHFELPDEVATWDDRDYFSFLQEHQLAYQAVLDQLRAVRQQDSQEYHHVLAQFQKVESYLARDFNRRYQQG